MRSRRRSPVPDERKDEDEEKPPIEKADAEEAGTFDIAADDEADLRPVDLSVLYKLLPYAKAYKSTIWFALGLVLIRTLAGLAGPKLQGWVLDGVTRSDWETAKKFGLLAIGVQTVMF